MTFVHFSLARHDAFLSTFSLVRAGATALLYITRGSTLASKRVSRRNSITVLATLKIGQNHPRQNKSSISSNSISTHDQVPQIPLVPSTMSAQPSNSGIVTDESGDRHIPESVRADGSVRKAIKIRPGYKPAEDVAVYKNRTAETFRNRYKDGVLGAEAADSSNDSNTNGAAGSSSSTSAAANKNAKRREARKKAKAAEGADGDRQDGCEASVAKLTNEPSAEGGESQEHAAQNGSEASLDPDAERKKKARNLTKKLKQAKELKSKKDDGQSLLPEQFAKVIKINELVRELAALGFDADGEPVQKGEEEEKKKKNDEVKEKAAPS